jgi:hypothetical protein
MSSHTEQPKIQNPGSYSFPSSANALFAVLAVLGVGAFVFGLSTDPDRAWASFLTNHFFYTSMALGGLFFAAIQWLTSAMWSAPLRRVSESFTAYLPFALISVIVLHFGIHHLYIWNHPEIVKGDPTLEIKSGYLSAGFFTIRNIVEVCIWIFFSYLMVGNSIAQDKTGDNRLTLRNRALAPGFLVLFALTYTLSSFDQLMSLDPHWASTMFGVYCFAGLFYANLASTCVLTIYLQAKGKLTGIVNDNHLHDMGKFMFAFTIFWAYIGFCQFMLIWYANIPEETRYFAHRFVGCWFYVSLFLLIGKFMTPFFLLLPRGAKRSPKMLVSVGIFMLVAQWIDVFWMVQPEFFKDGPHIGVIEIGMCLGFGGIFMLLVGRFLAKYNVVAIGDPRLAESVYHHHQ